jgi:transcriptional regulator with XRE-family HTH domain
MDFSKSVRSFAKRKNMSLVSVAKEMNISSQYLYDLLNGKRRWNQDTIDSACKVLDIKIQVCGG